MLKRLVKWINARLNGLNVSTGDHVDMITIKGKRIPCVVHEITSDHYVVFCYLIAGDRIETFKRMLTLDRSNVKAIVKRD